MSWAELIADETVTGLPTNDWSLELENLACALILEAIRETIEKCAEVAGDMLSGAEAAEAIRKLGEP